MRSVIKCSFSQYVLVTLSLLNVILYCEVLLVIEQVNSLIL